MEENNNKPKDTSWSKHWDNVDMTLYARVVIMKAYPTSTIRFNEPHLAVVLKDRHDTDNKDL